jgi:hypothetical protein
VIRTFLQLFGALLAFGGLCVLCYRWWVMEPKKPDGHVDSLWRDEGTPETKPTNITRKT